MESGKCAQPLFYLLGMMLILVCCLVTNRLFASNRKNEDGLPAAGPESPAIRLNLSRAS